MHTFHVTCYYVTYYYLATGMEGRADTRDYGMVIAESVDDAINKTIIHNYPRMSKSDAAWMKTCFTARRII